MLVSSVNEEAAGKQAPRNSSWAGLGEGGDGVRGKLCPTMAWSGLKFPGRQGWRGRAPSWHPIGYKPCQLREPRSYREGVGGARSAPPPGTQLKSRPGQIWGARTWPISLDLCRKVMRVAGEREQGDCISLFPLYA